MSSFVPIYYHGSNGEGPEQIGPFRYVAGASEADGQELPWMESSASTLSIRLDPTSGFLRVAGGVLLNAAFLHSVLLLVAVAIGVLGFLVRFALEEMHA